MKRNLLIVFAFCSLLAISCQKVIALKQVDDVCTMMEDIDFMKYCYKHFDANGDGMVSMSEAEAVTRISCRQYGSIWTSHSLKGIEYFKNLTYLNCDQCGLSTLDVSKNLLLEYISCSNNSISSLDFSKNTNLKSLECNLTTLKTLNVSKNTQLMYIECQKNGLTSLDLSKNTKLERLDCSYNYLSSLDLSKNVQLSSLNCTYNLLTGIDVSNNTQLEYFWFNPQQNGDITPTGWPK